MKTSPHRLIVGLMTTVGAAASITLAGPLTPPPGPVASTYKTLTEVEPRLALDQNVAPGDADALFKITSPGSYYLTASFSASSGRAFLEIAASNVTLDLNGFRIQGVAGSLDGIMTSGSVSNIVIRNGTVASFGGDGVDSASASHVRLEQLRVANVTGVGLRLGGSSTAVSCSVTGSGSHGVALTAGQSRLERSSISNSGGNGVHVSAPHNRIFDCTITGSAQTGVSLSGSSQLEQSTVQGSANVGVSMRARDRVANNTISGSTLNGISLSGAGIVENNQVLDNLNHGLYVYTIVNSNNGYMQIRNNTFIGNGDAAGEYGVFCAIDTFAGIIDGNIFRLNRGGIRVAGSTFTIMRNISGPNGGLSYHVDPDKLNDIAPIITTFTSTSPAHGNLDGGFYLVP